MSQTPTAASLFIDALLPKERAVLFSVLHSMKDAIEKDHSCFVAMSAKLDKDKEAAKITANFHKWHLDNLKNIIDKIFAECFPDDLNANDFFVRDYPELFITEKPFTTDQV